MLARLRKYIMTGLLIWVPLGITILVIKLLVDLMDKTILFLPPTWRPEAVLGFDIPGLGIVVASVIIFVTGFFLTNFAGRRLIKLGESVLDRIPLVRSIYSAVKQVTETVLSSEGDTFSEVYLIEYPRKGLWTLCFKTSNSPKLFDEVAGEALVTVFVPTTPNPTSGFILFVPISEAKKLDIEVEDALKLVMSLGVVAPGDKTINIDDIKEDIDKLKKRKKNKLK
ncbi:MAG: DUF502 domain-containing protein [Cocleimonas sp.]|nr:DUF502 domain-containing protein [Cocleimonas sp.]